MSGAASTSKPKRHFAVSAMAGFCSGATEAACTMPFDTIKTYVQVQRTGWEHPDRGAAHTMVRVRMRMLLLMRMWQSSPPPGITPIGAAKEIYKLKGFGGFYFGLPAVLVQVAGKGAIRFTSYEQYKKWLQAAGAPKASEDFVAGLGAGFTEAFLWTTPTERLKVLRQNDIRSGLNRYASLPSAIQTVRAEHGIRGLYAGIGACGIRQASGVGVRFAVYGRVKELLTTDPPQIWQSALAGGITGCASTAMNHPIDVVKTRIEAQDGAGKKEYTHTVQAFQSILKNEGPKALYRGIAPRMIKISLGQAITFTAYERYTDLIGDVADCLSIIAAAPARVAAC